MFANCVCAAFGRRDGGTRLPLRFTDAALGEKVLRGWAEQTFGEGQCQCTPQEKRYAFTAERVFVRVQERPPLSLQLAESVSLGARLALSHCQQQFRWRPWNCPAADFSLRAQRRVTREAALVSALTAAGVAHSVTRNCSRGDVPGCGCDDRLPQGLSYRRAGGGDAEQEERRLPAGESPPEEYAWQWGGCSEAPLYGQAVARRFLDGSEQPMDATAFARRHNHRVGVEVVRGSMETRCKCHGTSGSCSVQTCWRLLRPFHYVAARLERLYHDAIRINYDEQLGSIALGNSATMDHPDVSPEQLIYIEQSPNYCLPNRTSGWHGVRGRSCPKEVLDSGEVKDHCRDLCAACGFAVSQDARIQTVPCHCDFQWCCRISCQTCTSNVKYHHCK
ncbi:protein Wnt-8b-like [Schistocerca gregaria]|uniref:protein Wnt-8b-like n=1 Tax=Schistocerca gregaria TaxID=7010 RepID=UPI00211E7062|nr:protein Wnt-8b-like [Schistocerca gregaria]